MAPLLWDNARLTALRRVGGRCDECGVTQRLEVHHVMPLERGENRWNSPKNTQANLIVLCRKHHDQAHHPPRSLWAADVPTGCLGLADVRDLRFPDP